MADNFKFAQLQTFNLYGAGAVAGATSITLKSMKDIDGSLITMAGAFGTKGYGTMEPNNGTLEEQISFTGLVNNANGTTTLTGVKSVTFLSPYTETTGLSKTHAGSTSFIISNTSGYYDTFANKLDDEDITGVTWTIDDPVTPRQIANKEYVDSQVQTGSGGGNQIAARASKTDMNQSIPNGNVNTLITLNTVDFDTNSNFASNRFTATVEGYYQVNASAFFQAVENGIGYSTNIFVNGAQTSGTLLEAGAAGFNISVPISDVLFLKVGDFVELMVAQSGSGSVDVKNDPTATYLSIVFASATGEAILARAFLNAAPQTIPINTQTKVLLDQTNFNVGNDFDTANNQFLVLKEGYYQVAGSVYYLTSKAGVSYLANFTLNGSIVDTAFSSQAVVGAGDDVQIVLSDVMHLVPGDIVALSTRHAGASSHNLQNTTDSTYLSIYLISQGSGSGGGDVVGAASSTDKAITRFSGTTGKVIQNSGVTVSDLTANQINITTPSVAGTATKILIKSGNSSTIAGADMTIEGGDGTSAGDGGEGVVRGGVGGATGDGGQAFVQGGSGGATSGNGGNVQIEAGSSVAGNSDGGNVNIVPGAGDGSGARGRTSLFGKRGDLVSADLDLDAIASTTKVFRFPNQSGIFATVTFDVVAPGTTPAAVGQIFVDTVLNKVYISTGTASSADWTILN